MKKIVLTAVLALTTLSGILAPAGAAPEQNYGPEGGSKALENPGAAEKGRVEKNNHQTAEKAGDGGDNRSGKENPKLAFPVISDIHVQSWHAESHRKFIAALGDLNQINPNANALIINGDLTNGMPADYAKLTEIMSTAPHPNKVFYTMGNHEYYNAWLDKNGHWNPSLFPNGETEQASISRFLQFSGEKKVYYDQTIGGYHFIFLGSEQYRQSDPANLEDAFLSQEQLEWLKKTLNKGARSDKPMFVFLHQPLPYTVAGTDFCCVNNRAVVQHERLKAILSQYPQVIYFSGHSHWELKLPKTLVQERFTMVNSSAVVQPWTDDGNGGEMLTGPEESEGLYVEVYDEKVLIRGRDFFRKRWIPEAQFTVPVSSNVQR